MGGSVVVAEVVALGAEFDVDAVGEVYVVGGAIFFDADDAGTGLLGLHVVADVGENDVGGNGFAGRGFNVFPVASAVEGDFGAVGENHFVLADATEILVDFDYAHFGVEVIGDEGFGCGREDGGVVGVDVLRAQCRGRKG